MDANDRDYSNGEIIVHWKPDKCIHATTCYKELIEVFNPRKRPWVNMEGAPTERIIEVVKKCPTQALSYTRIKGEDKVKTQQEGDNSSAVSGALVRVMKDGPLVVQGDFIIYDTRGKEQNKMKMTSFCRCGGSNNMPFCDGTHRKIGFTSE